MTKRERNKQELKNMIRANLIDRKTSLKWIDLASGIRNMELTVELLEEIGKEEIHYVYIVKELLK